MGRALELENAAGRIGAWRADPLGKPLGALVVVQEIFGVNAHIRGVVDRFAAHGFVAVAPALFDHVERGVELGYDESGIARGRELAAAVGFDRAVASVLACADGLGREARTGVVGFCWGGTVAFLAGVRGSRPAVVYYGGRSVPFLHERGNAPLLFHFGERDPLIPEQDRALHRALQPDAEIHV